MEDCFNKNMRYEKSRLISFDKTDFGYPCSPNLSACRYAEEGFYLQRKANTCTLSVICFKCGIEQHLDEATTQVMLHLNACQFKSLNIPLDLKSPTVEEVSPDTVTVENSFENTSHQEGHQGTDINVTELNTQLQDRQRDVSTEDIGQGGPRNTEFQTRDAAHAEAGEDEIDVVPPTYLEMTNDVTNIMKHQVYTFN